MAHFSIYYFIVGILIAVVAARYVQSNHTRRRVFSNLDNAYENGYFEHNEQLHNASADEIAYDMTCYSSYFESERPETLTPYVRQWMKQKGL